MQRLTKQEIERIIELAARKNQKPGNLRSYLNSLEMPECDGCKCRREELKELLQQRCTWPGRLLRATERGR